MKQGFTLSEILIALGIVGVVAALTIPPVVVKYQKKMYSTKLEKEYAKISNSILEMMDEERVSNFFESNTTQTQSCDSTTKVCSSGAGYFLQKYIVHDNKDCSANPTTCLASNYKSISDTTLTMATQDYCVRATSGATICAKNYAKVDATEDTDEIPAKFRFYVDVNGVDKPNIAGRDLFVLNVDSEGSIVNDCPAVSCGDATKTTVYDSTCGCLTSLIDDGWKMEY